MPSTDTVELREGVFSDLISAAFQSGKAAINFKEKYRQNLAKQRNKSYMSKTSISRIARDLTMSFPTICSDSIDGNTAILINKAIERKNVVLIQMVAAAAHLQGLNGQDIISQIHTNMGVNYNIDDYIDSILAFRDTISTEGAIPCTGEYAVLAEQAKQEFLNSLNKRYPISNVSESSINDYQIMNYYGNDIQVFKEMNYLDAMREYDKKKRDRDQRSADSQADRDQKQRQWQDDYEYRKEEDDRRREERQRDRNAQKEKDDYQKRRDMVNQQLQNFEDKHAYLSKQLLDSDVKKANELQPTMILIRYQVAGQDKDSSEVNNYINDEFVAGVKSRLIAVKSNDILDRIKDMNSNGVSMKGLIKATTKETSFTKDFLAAISQAKIDAKKDSKLSKKSGIWRSLQARSARSTINRLMRTQNGAAAITTLVLSIQEVVIARDEYNIDLANPDTAVEFMNSYNLLALVIVDEQLETADFIYDGDAYFEKLSFTSLQKDNDRSYKQVIDLLNKSR